MNAPHSDEEPIAQNFEPQPMQFSAAELAVIYQILLGEELPGGNNLLADLQVTTADIHQARQNLLARGLLLQAADESDFRLEPALWSVFNIVMYPQILGILQLSSPNQPEKAVHLSWAAGRVVLNKVDAAGTHYLEPLASAEAVAEAIMRECGLEGEVHTGSPDATDSPLPSDPEAVFQNATVRALFLTVVGFGHPEPQGEAVAWLLSDGQLWLMAQHDEATAAMNRINAADLYDLIRSFAQHVSEIIEALGEPAPA